MSEMYQMLQVQSWESISTEEKKLDGNHGHYRPIELVTLQGHQDWLCKACFREVLHTLFGEVRRKWFILLHNPSDKSVQAMSVSLRGGRATTVNKPDDGGGREAMVMMPMT
ncbi:hypothetical protein ZWY2020_030117 [Hordeum vulgare]|nr:hypothetical protein ZWY2020_030117 [Hordeum vulgare]